LGGGYPPVRRLFLEPTHGFEPGFFVYETKVFAGLYDMGGIIL